jgi:hypothetical protein
MPGEFPWGTDTSATRTREVKMTHHAQPESDAKICTLPPKFIRFGLEQLVSDTALGRDAPMNRGREVWEVWRVEHNIGTPYVVIQGLTRGRKIRGDGECALFEIDERELI